MCSRRAVALTGLLLVAIAGSSACRRRPSCCPCPQPPPAALPAAKPEAAPAPSEPAPSEPAPSEPASDVVAVLEKKRVRGLHWEDIDLDQAVTYLRTITGIDFVISPRVRADKFEDIIISLQLDGVSVRVLLDQITEPYTLRWRVRDGVVHVLTVDEVEGPRVVQIHDVHDLVGAEAAYVSVSQLVNDIQTHLYPTYWERASIRGVGTNLVVRASEAVQDEIADYLASERALIITPSFEPALRKKLETTLVNLSVEVQPLASVLKLLRLQTGMNIVIDPHVAYAFNDVPIVGWELEDVALSLVLKILVKCLDEDAAFVGKGTAIVLTRREWVGK